MPYVEETSSLESHLEPSLKGVVNYAKVKLVFPKKHMQEAHENSLKLAQCDLVKAESQEN